MNTGKIIPPPWQWQAQARERAKNLNNFALLAEMGTGKSRAQVDILRDKFNAKKRVLRTIIFAPVVVLENWRRELLKYSNISPDKILILEGDSARRKARFSAMEEKHPLGFIVIVNYDKIRSPDVMEMLMAWDPEVMVCDESHYIKDHKAKWTKALIELRDGGVRHCYIMSGTPILNSMMDLWAQFRVLDGGEALGRNFYVFQQLYFYDEHAPRRGKPGYYPKWVPRPGAAEELNRIIYSKAVRVTKAECLDLPPLVRKHVFVTMSEEQSRLYAEMKRDFVTYLGDKACVATLAMIKAMRLQQIVSGYVKLEDGREIELDNAPRLAALKELLEQITPQHKVIVWAKFKANYAQIRRVCDELGVGYEEIHGEAKGNPQETADRFNTDPTRRVLIGNAGSGGIGINLTSASYTIFFSRDFSRAKDEQARARNHRAGSEVHERITQIDLVCPGTIDETVLEAINNKVSIAEAVLSWKDRV